MRMRYSSQEGKGTKEKVTRMTDYIGKGALYHRTKESTNSKATLDSSLLGKL